MKEKNKVYFYTNTKMFKNLRETLDYLQKLNTLTKDLHEEIELSVMPPLTALYPAGQLLENSHLLLGAQNVCGEDGREYTGEISPSMLQELGVSLVMAGHSERRRKLGETNGEINRKVRGILDQGMIALLSISETLEDKECGISDEVLRTQVKECLYQVSQEQTENLRILYEPAWAVGAFGKIASPDYVQKRHQVIKECLKELYGEKTGGSIPVIYGGSVNRENACDLFAGEAVDGLGIGRSAWNAEDFNSIIRKVMKK